MKTSVVAIEPVQKSVEFGYKREYLTDLHFNGALVGYKAKRGQGSKCNPQSPCQAPIGKG